MAITKTVCLAAWLWHECKSPMIQWHIQLGCSRISRTSELSCRRTMCCGQSMMEYLTIWSSTSKSILYLNNDMTDYCVWSHANWIWIFCQPVTRLATSWMAGVPVVIGYFDIRFTMALDQSMKWTTCNTKVYNVWCMYVSPSFMAWSLERGRLYLHL